MNEIISKYHQPLRDTNIYIDLENQKSYILITKESPLGFFRYSYCWWKGCIDCEFWNNDGSTNKDVRKFIKCLSKSRPNLQTFFEEISKLIIDCS